MEDSTAGVPLQRGGAGAAGAQWPRDTVPAAALDRSLPRALLALVAVAVAAAVAFSLLSSFGRPAAWALPALAAAIALCELTVASMQVGRQQWQFSISDAVLTLTFALVPGSWMVLAAPAGVAVAQLLKRKAAPKIVFNVCQYAASTAAGVYVARTAEHAHLPQLTAAALAIAAFFAIQTLLVAAIVAATTETSLPRLLLRTAPIALVHTAGSASVGLLAAWLTLTAPAGLVGLLVPVILLWSSFDQTSRRAAEARLFAELARGQEQAGGGSVDASAQVVVTTAARLLGADVDMLLFSAEGLVRYRSVEHAAPLRERVPVSTMQEPWIPEVLSGGVVLGHTDQSPSCGLRVGPAERPLALLQATRRPGDSAFTRRDASLSRVLVTQAENWLSVADLTASRDAAVGRADAADSAARALGDIGAHTAPALSALRESAGRLARLAGGGTAAGARANAASGQDPVDDIVAELRSAEQAVASLLGAIAIAADADLAGSTELLVAPLPAVVRPAEDWTSTGSVPAAP